MNPFQIAGSLLIAVVVGFVLGIAFKAPLVEEVQQLEADAKNKLKSKF